ncbi:MCE family protein [Acidiferrimicrobium sp. IK]|uniref:MCE family protein n=1 Tax=Acidiferrimicrobium sp. IK TaxID=2871700 RepID=UPI0021CAED0F|nr:MCE family protein [Acidiferrimicrobium sp. IK]MCU4186875.1 MCE family protein [Acidiferrimicrobium sp. IK]
MLVRGSFAYPRGLLVGVIILAGVVGVVVARSGQTSMRTIRAVFAQAPGLYAGNHVDVLGMPVGSVTSVSPQPGGVLVTMSVQKRWKIPAGVSAILDAPQVVNDRNVELSPAYGGGPTLADGATLPVTRTSEPLTVDQILGTLNSLFVALGPTAADKSGVLSNLITQLNRQLDGQGQPLHDTIAAASAAATGLAADAPQLAGTLSQLDSFVSVLAADSQNYEQFTSSLSGAAGQLNDERGQLAAALSTLQQTLADVATFVKANGSAIGGTVRNLDTAVSAVAAQQRSLAQALELTPLAGQNLSNTVGIDYTVPGQPKKVIMARVDGAGDSLGALQTICGSDTARAVRQFVEGNKTTTLDPICAFGAAAAELQLAPGGPAGPDMSLPALLAAQRR